VTPFELRSIGRVESPLKSVEAAPRQADEDAPGAWLVFEPEVREALRGLRVGQAVIVITWLDRARRDILSVHPRGDSSRPVEGVFNTRSPHRPNPIGLHEVKITAIDDLRLQVRSLEAIHGTPIVDLKPVLNEDISQR
jgi:tRNA-Thr(GGU) m(6)t(6)A37 methyltransferase TsaA